MSDLTDDQLEEIKVNFLSYYGYYLTYSSLDFLWNCFVERYNKKCKKFFLSPGKHLKTLNQKSFSRKLFSLNALSYGFLMFSGGRVKRPS